MPERPKRRKNNKNKRKNKNNKPEVIKNNSDEKKLDSGESCNSKTDSKEDLVENESVVSEEIKQEILQPSIENEIASGSTSSDVVNLNGDLNNNSDEIVENVPPSPTDKCVVVDTVDASAYVVEAPGQSRHGKSKVKLSSKSKSLDDDEATKIIDVTEDVTAEPSNENALALIDTQNVIVTHVDSDVEWENAAELNEVDVKQPKELVTGTLSVTSIPLTVAQCEQTKSLTPDEEKSLRNYLNTLNLATQPDGVNSVEIKTEIEEIINQEIKHRLRKKAMADDFFLHRLGPPRMLDVIDEEGSSGSSMTSRRQSYLSDKRSDVEDLEDDVFEDNKNKLTKQKKMMSTAVHKKSFGKLVPQECLLVGAKIKEPEVSEARGDWTMKTVEKMTGAEVVYLTDTSSSTSSLHEIGEDDDDGVDTDASVRMITPTIEVTDTENFLKKTFISNTDNNKQDTNTGKTIEIPIQIIPNEKVSDEIEKKNTNAERIIKVQVENDTSVNIEKIVPEKRTTERIVEVTYDKEIKENSQQLVRNETKSNEHIIKVALEQDAKKNDVEVITSTNKTDNDRNLRLESEKTSEQSKNIVENISSQNSHEIVVLSTDNIKTNLYVKDIEEPINKDDNKMQAKQNKYELESKLIKCEFNDAINNLIKEVVSESEETNENAKETFSRQDSSSSVDSSQCTAKYNPNYSSLNDIVSMTHDETTTNNKTNTEQVSSTASHVKDVFECVTGAPRQNKTIADDDTKEPLKLRDLCVRNIATLPYGKKILEELASVSERLQNIALYGAPANVIDKKPDTDKMPHYRLPDVSSIDTITIPVKTKDPVPPPVKPRRSSLRKTSQEEEHWTGVPTKTEPVYVCLSPSQKMLMEKTNTVITKDEASHLVDMHRKFVDRRGYNEQYKSDKEREESDVDSTPVIPFKSQTGSRLLALIRDPTLTNNINSLNQRLNSSTDDIQRKRTTTTSTTFMKSNHDRFANRDFSFKPIPPPRPKKYSSSFYESDESSDFTDSSMRSMKSERKFFHYSTGNLNKEIESDVSSIQNMHRFFTDKRDEINDYKSPRRPSLPKDLCEQQMEYIRKKEKEVEAEIQRLEALKSNIPQMQKSPGPRAPLISEKEVIDERIKDSNNYSISRKKDVVMTSHGSEPKKGKLSSVFSSSQEELLREKMYSEYVSQMAEREERRQHKVIKITNTPSSTNHITVSKSMPALDILDAKVNNRIEKEFISKARERWDKLGIKDPETEDERESNNVYKEPKVIEHKIKVIEGGEEKDVKKLPSHLQEFVRFTAKDSEKSTSSADTVMIAPTFKARSTSPAIWRPGAPPPVAGTPARSPGVPPPPPPPPVWTPGSAGASPQTPRKTFRPVHFEETPPARRKFPNSEQNGATSGSESEGRLRTSHSAPVTGLSNLGGSNFGSRLPKAQNPTVTLLQKAREGQISRGSNYIQQERDAARLPRDRPSPPRGDPVHALRKEYASEGEADRSDYERGGIRKMADAQRKVEGIGPITKDGMPVALRSEVKDPSRWYKKMYDTIHKNKYDDDYVTIRYKSRRGQPPERVLSNKSQYAYFDPRSGYLSEPEGGLSRLGSSTWSDAYDSDVTTGPRRRTASVQEDRRFNDVNSQYSSSTNKYSTLASARASQEVYKNQPGRIENYVPGKSSVVDKEAKQWWDEVMDIFDGWLDDNSPLPPYTTLLARAIQKSQNISSTTSLPQSSPKEKKDLTATILSKSNMARALKESGYESDSTLVFRRREDTEAPLSPAERRAAYRDLQAGGEPPLRGFRSPAPPRQENDSAPEPPRRTSHGSYSDTESPRRYVESDVNIHYRCPVRHDPLPLVPERELARQQAEHMKRLYREQKRNKYLQELQDMQNRRHQDNFTPSQKNILPLNRYDEAEKVIAKALYTFNGQTARELSFRKGELIHVRRQIDNNWYEGELHGRIGLFPYNYVEIQKGDVVQTPKKPAVVEGRARAKFDFTAQTNLELPLKKGEVVVLTRRIDQNWWEGRNGSKTGIFPDSYVTVLQEPSPNKPDPQPILNSDKPVASPAAHGLLNGSAKRSMGSHSYTPQPNSPALSNAPPATQPLPGHVAKPAQATLTPSERGYGPPTGAGVDLNNTEPLYVDTNAEAIPYRAMYKYRPQNPDELELNEGDTVYVLEKCDDGWYVGSSQRTGRFGTFPGNYVERI
ncbi:uncharacterized protein LOC118268087 isoform X4 [Spodoptera frugiperda]|uniref:Uncharacterized protein LOC118268087 isoform X4 n=1 Tax=Spodoptera frugiperda TaxID=7108 RepID=A0A9R0EAS8_SPOFR|nr:uncharacterized protein LOC118268087 isoform X4 [Spodoptera frugiperda]